MLGERDRDRDKGRKEGKGREITLNTLQQPTSHSMSLSPELNVSGKLESAIPSFL